MHHPTDRIVHTTAFVTPVVEHWPKQTKSDGLTGHPPDIKHQLDLYEYVHIISGGLNKPLTSFSGTVAKLSIRRLEGSGFTSQY